MEVSVRLIDLFSFNKFLELCFRICSRTGGASSARPPTCSPPGASGGAVVTTAISLVSLLAIVDVFAVEAYPVHDLFENRCVTFILHLGEGEGQKPFARTSRLCVKKKFFNKFQIPRSGLQCYSSMIQSPFVQVVVIIVVIMYSCASLFPKITRSIQKSRSGEDTQQSKLTHHSGGRRKRAQRHDVNA